MKHRLRMTKRNRLRLVVLAVLAMLCQQVAFAAYVCPVTVMPAADMATSAHCSAMPMVKDATASALAAQYCAFHNAHPTVVSSNVQLPGVPPLLLPAILPVQPLAATLSVAYAAHTHAAVQLAPPLPPPLRYRVLLI